MPVVPFGEYKPDISDYEASSERDAQNVVARADGYGPFPSLTALSASLGQQCRGAFEAYNADDSVTVFAATATGLFMLNATNLTWTNVSLGGAAYSTIAQTDQWNFVQFSSLVIAVQANVVPQVWILGTSTAFANLAGNPPQARYAAIVGQFVVLSGLLSNPIRVQWSGLADVNGVNSWTPGINSSDYQDLYDGGFCRGVGGGEASGVIYQDTIVRSMVYLPGSPLIFQIEKISVGLGLSAPQSLVVSGVSQFFYSLKGFHRIDPGALPVPIGRERIDRTFLGNYDATNPQLFQGTADPRSGRIIWVYKSINGTLNQFDSALCYDPVLDKFTPLQFSGEYLFQMSAPGVTLEGIDALTPGNQAVLGVTNNGAGLCRVQVASTAALFTGQYCSIQNVVGTTEANGNRFINVIDATHFDLIGSAFVHAYVSGGLLGGNIDLWTTQSLDNFTTAIVPELAAFDVNHALNFFRGPSLQATLETSEQGTNGQRIKIRNGFRPITDAPTVFGSCSRRENLQAAAVAGAEYPINPVTGICNQLVDTRYTRFKVRIPAGTIWTYINGVEPDMIATGKR